MKLVGLSKVAAIAALTKAGHTYRIAREDDRSYMLTSDVQFNRCNLTIEKGVVTRATYG